MASGETLTLAPVGTFFNTPICTDIDELSADVAFIGIPYEFGKGLRNPSGQKFAPKAIRDQKRFYLYPGGEAYPTEDTDKHACGRFNPNTGVEELKSVTMADCGDLDILPSEGERNFERMTKVVRKILVSGAFPVVIGGDHSITFPVVRAFDRYDPLDIVYFDAHPDFTDEQDGVRIYGGSSFIRCSELPFIRNITNIGLEWCPKKEAYDAALSYGCKIITAERFREIGVAEVLKNIPQADNIYISIDVDVLEPSVAPGTSVPTPGGLRYLELRQLLRGLPKRGKIVGFDLVEVDPMCDCNNLTSRTAVELILDLLGAVFPAQE